MKTWFWDEFLKRINFLRNEHVEISFFQLIYDVYNDVSLCLGPLWYIFQYYAFIFVYFGQILLNFDDWDKNLRISWSMKNRSQQAYFAKNWSVLLKIPNFWFLLFWVHIVTFRYYWLWYLHRCISPTYHMYEHPVTVFP